jgi:5-carboxymethyl-2-hydroxymuconate isomerase
MLEQVVLGGSIATGCAIIEAAGLKGTNAHIKMLFELRNAFIHNQFNIAKNNNKNALKMASEYIVNELHREISSQVDKPFFSLKGTIIELQPDVLFVIRLCLL